MCVERACDVAAGLSCLAWLCDAQRQSGKKVKNNGLKTDIVISSSAFAFLFNKIECMF